MDFLLRDATSDDLPRLQEIFRRSSLSNEGDRPALVDHPEALVYAASSLSAGRARVATVMPDVARQHHGTTLAPQTWDHLGLARPVEHHDPGAYR
jgi:hypothetical protein